MVELSRKFNYRGHSKLSYEKRVHLFAYEMNEIRENDAETWKILSVVFSVNKSGILFCNIFSDQNLEQHFKVLKNSGCF